MHRARRALALVALLLVLLGFPVPGRAAPLRCFPETGFCIGDGFAEYWASHGGLAQFGLPLTGERAETLEDGKQYTVQYFERARFEAHPENAAPNDILLGPFGRRILAEDYRTAGAGAGQALAPVAPLAGTRFFPETGHNVGGRFLAYWEAHGDLAQFGYPLTEERFDYLPGTGQNCCQTQYFERARFEYHPENAGTPYEVLLGQFGRRILADNALLTADDFRALYFATPAIRDMLGRPLAAPAGSSVALQTFERGRMYYVAGGDLWMPATEGPRIIVFQGEPRAGQLLTPGEYPFFLDEWREGQDPGGGAAPVPDRYLPRRGFGKVWRERGLQGALGYALTPHEVGFVTATQSFSGGILLLSDTPEGRFIYMIAVAKNCNGCGYQGTYERYAPVTGR